MFTIILATDILMFYREMYSSDVLGLKSLCFGRSIYSVTVIHDHVLLWDLAVLPSFRKHGVVSGGCSAALNLY